MGGCLRIQMSGMHEYEPLIGKLTGDSLGYSLGGCGTRARREAAGVPVVPADLLGRGG